MCVPPTLDATQADIHRLRFGEYAIRVLVALRGNSTGTVRNREIRHHPTMGLDLKSHMPYAQ
jgi:hypothetical protein